MSNIFSILDLVTGIFTALPEIGVTKLTRGEVLFHEAISKMIPEIDEECKRCGLERDFVIVQDFSGISQLIMDGIQYAMDCCLIELNHPSRNILTILVSKDFFRLFFHEFEVINFLG